MATMEVVQLSFFSPTSNNKPLSPLLKYMLDTLLTLFETDKLESTETDCLQIAQCGTVAFL